MKETDMMRAPTSRRSTFAVALGLALCASPGQMGCALMPERAELCGPVARPSESARAREAGSDVNPHADLSGLPHGIRHVPCAKALCYVIVLDPAHPATAPLDDVDVVLIDTGIDATGELLLESLNGANVVQVWVTHGHIDHWAAAHLFVDDSGQPVPVRVHRADIPFMRLERQHRSVFAIIGQQLLPLPPLPRALRAFDDGDRLTAASAAGAVHAEAVHLPGHTPGSSAFLFRDVLFGGDSLVGAQPGGVCAVQGFLVTDDEVTAWRSLRKLRDVPFRVLLDGNYGRTDGAAALVQPALLRWRDRRSH